MAFIDWLVDPMGYNQWAEDASANQAQLAENADRLKNEGLLTQGDYQKEMSFLTTTDPDYVATADYLPSDPLNSRGDAGSSFKGTPSSVWYDDWSTRVKSTVNSVTGGLAGLVPWWVWLVAIGALVIYLAPILGLWGRKK